MNMRRFGGILTLFLLTASCCGTAFGATARWMGEGKTGKASDRMNWSLGRLPAEKDHVIFGALSSRDCDWDLDISLSSFSVTYNYKGDIKFQSSLRVAGNMNIEGGMVHLRTASLTVGRRLYVGLGGIFELSDGELNVGPAGILVDAGGTFYSRGKAKARIASAKPGRYYRFIVGRGNVTFSNPSGTDVEGSSGMTFYSLAEVSRADFVNVKRIKPGEPALRLFRAPGQLLEPKSWTFDKTVEKKIATPDARLEKLELAAMDREAPVTDAEALKDQPSGIEQKTAQLPETAADEPQDPPFAGLAEYEAAQARARFVPYLSAQFSGGQYFSGGERGGLSGNINLLASVAVKHEKLGGWTLMPVFSSQYQGTKQVTDLVGGGTLFQERMGHSVAVRGVYQVAPGWKIKPSIGYKWEFLKETRDESWGDGLFDYRRPGLSVEGEYTYSDPFTLRMGYDFYQIGFVNYRSLESIIKDSQGNALARELAGDSVLDSYNHSIYAGGTKEGPWRSYFDGNLALTLRLFPEQHVVDGGGQLNNPTRRDLASQLAVGWHLPRQLSSAWKAVGGARFSAGYNVSNQNSYDAQRIRFLKDYYDSTSVRAGVDFNLYRNLKRERPLELDFSATLGRTDYYGRRSQESSGLYLGSRIYQHEAVVSVGLSYPIAPQFVWTSRFGYGRQTSNQHFERLYRYNLATTTYRIGFGYEF